MEEEEDEEETKIPMREFDKRNINNPIFVPHIAECIITNLFKEEQSMPLDISSFSRVQTEIQQNVRNIVVRWMINIHHHFKLSSQTLYNSVYYLDYILSHKNISKSDIQILGASCLWEAAKLEEVKILDYTQIAEYCKNEYDVQDFENYERFILKQLLFRIQLPSPKEFLKRFLCGIDACKEIREVSFFLCESSLYDYQIRAFLPSKVAFTIVLVATYSLNMQVPLPTLMGYAHMPDFNGLIICTKCIINATNEVIERRDTTYQKYTSNKRTGAVLMIQFTDELFRKISYLDPLKN
ncbi:Cyclin, N-terminal domain containing protein [Histomonas meleagridis]|uniref:Cyclin, N-terminal domain containing protein n=1 Tax=Histomonas meleagridis TaxID=135588 RepID=UPI00355A2366|nr:Cyclin, N-terminal domain containing protein [Histomonas meleagridis]KAH0796775.1 Cyclin, N-terminal domain containing protein [Histomonas meleagridis]